MGNIKEEVINLISEYGTTNPYKICKEKGILIRYFSYDTIKGFFKEIEGQSFIVLNSNLSKAEKELVLLHEIGHSVLHNREDILFMNRKIENFTAKLEREANEFVAEFLIIKYSLSKNHKKDIIEKLKNI